MDSFLYGLYMVWFWIFDSTVFDRITTFSGLESWFNSARYFDELQNLLFSHASQATILTYKTRASAQRVTNIPSRRHFLIIKYFKVNDNDIRQDIVYNVSLWVTLIHHPKYTFPAVNSQDMMQICWAIKYVTDLHILEKLIWWSHWCIIPTMMLIH